MRALLGFALALAVSGCGTGDRDTGAAAANTAVAASVATSTDVAGTSTGTPLQPHSWPLPSPDGAAQSDLVRAPDGDLLLSWVHPDGEGHALAFARYSEGRWSEPRIIARGNDWFVNWADTPHILATADGALWAHWLQKSAAATYAYDIALVRSGNDGASWSAPVLVNDDGTPTEHGFVSLWPMGEKRVGVAWLDGRETADAGHHGDAPSGDDHHAGHGDGTTGAAATPAMTLRTAVFDAALARSAESRIDAMTCDCCQTDAAATTRGPLLVYRDRTGDEVRDIAAVRLENGRWSAPRPVHADDWTMPACPVNGPALAARGDEAVVGWYTAAGDEPTLKLARSSDAGDRFGAPVVVDRGTPVQGRVDVLFAGDSVWVLWLREDDGAQSLHLARYSADLSREWQRIELARLQGRGRGTGFPRLAATEDGVHMVWTDVVEGRPRLHGARVPVVTADAP